MASLKNLLVLGSARFLNTIKGTIEKAEKLGTPRTFQTNLGSTSAASFDGSANVTPGVTGTLPVANGGTGKTNLKDAENAMLNALDTGSSTPTDNDYYISQYVDGGTTTTTYHRRPVSALWDYINNKISAAGYAKTSIPDMYVGTCTTAAGTKDKVVTLNDATGFSLKTGAIVAVKFTYTNTYSSTTDNPVTLNVNETGAKNIYYNATHSGAGNTGTVANAYGRANLYAFYVYDGTYWVWVSHTYDLDTNYHLPICTTSAGTAAKVVNCNGYYLLPHSYIPIVIQNTNTATSALTLNINGQGAKSIYINGSVSSSSNNSLPRGTYLVYYDGTIYFFRTDGLIQGRTAGPTVNNTTLATTAFVQRGINNIKATVLLSTAVSSTSITKSIDDLEDYSLFLIEYYSGSDYSTFLNSTLVSLSALKSQNGITVKNVSDSDYVYVKYTSGTSFTLSTAQGASNRYIKINGLL